MKPTDSLFASSSIYYSGAAQLPVCSGLTHPDCNTCLEVLMFVGHVAIPPCTRTRSQFADTSGLPKDAVITALLHFSPLSQHCRAAEESSLVKMFSRGLGSGYWRKKGRNTILQTKTSFTFWSSTLTCVVLLRSWSASGQIHRPGTLVFMFGYWFANKDATLEDKDYCLKQQLLLMPSLEGLWHCCSYGSNWKLPSLRSSSLNQQCYSWSMKGRIHMFRPVQTDDRRIW